jgi:hypothetical protein
MKRIAAPMVGGMLSSTILTLLVIPAIYSLWRQREARAGAGQEDSTMTNRSVGRLVVPLAAIVLVAGATGCGDNNTTAPGTDTVLESVSPAAGATGVDPMGSIVVRFSGPMATGMEQYVDLHQGDVSGPIVPMTCTFSGDRTTLTCTHAQPLQPGTGYTIHLGSGMMDGSGHPVEVESHGMAMGGQPVTGQIMGGMHGGQPMGMMGQGWQDGDGHLGMEFTFQTS